MELVRRLNQAPYASIESGPRPLAVREPVPLLALPALIVDPHLEEVEKKIGCYSVRIPRGNNQANAEPHGSNVIDDQESTTWSSSS